MRAKTLDMPRTRPGLSPNRVDADVEHDRDSDDEDDEQHDDDDYEDNAPAPDLPSKGKFVNALDYLDALKRSLPQTQYTAFLDIMKDFKAQRHTPLLPR